MAKEPFDNFVQQHCLTR